jgi:hypothetical protein
MSRTIYCSIDDRKLTKGLIEFPKKDDELFKQYNARNWGIYFSVNEFETNRRGENCKKLRYVYGDLDIAKAGDGQTREERESKKNNLLKSMIEKCEPTLVIDTSNGLQPLWAITDNEPTEENRAKYTQVIKGIIEWSKQYGCMADNVYDVSRILRLPGYYHQKEEPYLCQTIYNANKKYSLDQLKIIFPYEETKPTFTPVVSSDKNYSEVDEIDFRDLITKAFASKGRPVQFDESGHMIDPQGGTTGTFIGRKGKRDYLASSSHEPFKGNRVTAVADILGVDNKEAFKWICKEYNIKLKPVTTNDLTPIKVKKDYKLRYTWGTRTLDTSFAIIKRGNFIVLAAKSGSGKTTFAFDMAIKNANLGHKVIFLSLEMDEQEIKEDFARKYAGYTIQEELDYEIPEYKQDAFNKKIEYINSIDNLKIIGIRRDGNTRWTDIEEIVKQNSDVDLLFVDNLDLISSEERENDLERQKRIVKSILNFTSLTKIPVVLIHHYRKSPASGKDSGLDEMSGSGKIRDGADRIVKVTRNGNLDAVYPDKFKSVVYLQKGRGYPESMKDVYFIKGTFVDVAPSEEDYFNKPVVNDNSKQIKQIFNI